jgi:hypothetical protein
MNRLQKRAKQELILIVVCSLINLICFSFLVARNAQGADCLLICLVAGIPIALVAVLKQRHFEKQLDEREIAMYRNANMWATWAFVSYLLVFCFSVFFLVGGGGQAPVWFFPAMLFSGLLIAQATQSAILLFWCDKEQSDE